MPLHTKKLHPVRGRESGWATLTMQAVAIGDRLFAVGGLGQGGQILRSDDQGATWTTTQWRDVKATGPWANIMESGNQHGLRQVASASRDAYDELFAVGEYGTMLHSTDGGDTWTHENGVGDGCMFGLIHLEAGWFAAGDGGVYKRTRDGTWNNVDATRGLARFYRTPRGILIVGDKGVLLLIDERGAIEKLKSGTNQDLYGCTSIGDRVVLCGAHGTILVSDRTRFEKRDTPPVVQRLRLMEVIALVHASGSALVSVGEAGTMISSVDAGETWQVEKSPTTADLWGATVAVDGRSALLSASEGLVYRATWKNERPKP